MKHTLQGNLNNTISAVTVRFILKQCRNIAKAILGAH